MSTKFVKPYIIFTKDPAVIPSDLGVWGYARRYLPFSEEAPEAEVIEHLQEQRAQLWVGTGCAGVTEVTDDQNMHVWLAGGDIDGLLDMLPSVTLWAGVNDCVAVEVNGRKGWSRVLKNFDFVRNGDSMLRYV